jgi:CRP-like cAMP-binding protein
MTQSTSIEQARAQLQERLRLGAEAQGRPVTLHDGQVLFEANASSDGLYVLERGELRIYIRNPSGDVIELATLTPGAVIGEMSLLGEATRSASCRASSDDTLLLFVDRDEALALIDGDPQARQALVLILSERARNMVRFIHDFSHLTALVAKGDYNGVQTLISSSGTQDPSVRAARDAFKAMLDRVKQREAELQSTIATLSLEIDHQRAAQEVESILGASSFQTLQQNSADLRRRLRGE